MILLTHRQTGTHAERQNRYRHHHDSYLSVTRKARKPLICITTAQNWCVMAIRESSLPLIRQLIIQRFPVASFYTVRSAFCTLIQLLFGNRLRSLYRLKQWLQLQHGCDSTATVPPPEVESQWRLSRVSGLSCKQRIMLQLSSDSLRERPVRTKNSLEREHVLS